MKRTELQKYEAAARFKGGEDSAILMREFDATYGTLSQWGYLYFPDVRRPRADQKMPRVHSNISKPATRDADMVVAFRSGLTLQQVGDQHNVTRERVRQVLSKLGVSATEAEARTARAEYMAANNLPKPTKAQRAMHAEPLRMAA